MVDLTRRKTVIGLGLLATGSGATFTSAAFENAVDSDSDLRVVVQQQGLEFEGNSADSPDPFAVDNPNFFEDGSSGGLNETDGSAFDDTQAPLAFAEGSNENLTVRTAVPLGRTVTFDELFRVTNNSDEPVTIGIAYDRNDSDFDANSDNSGQYGADVSVGASGVLNEADAQAAYQFRSAAETDSDVSLLGAGTGNDSSLISPEPGRTGVEGNTGNEGTNIVDEDLPAVAARIPVGSTLVLNLDVDTSNDNRSGLGDRIENEADIDQSALGLQTDTVQIIDGITIVTFGDNVVDPTA
jgi:hypothetical protein